MRQIASAAAAAALVLLAGCFAQPGPDPAEPINPPSVSSSPTRASDVIHFGNTPDHRVFLTETKDVDQLVGTSPAFKDFIASQLASLAVPAGASDCEVGVGVVVYDPAGFAQGSVNACGGYAALWGIQDGKWKELIGTQDLWACADLRKFKVPVTITDTCYESMKEVPYTG